jgi:cell wall assembly regulator SMI1
MEQQIDLKKLEEKFEAFFEEETEESFNNWLANKTNNMKQTVVEWFAEKQKRQLWIDVYLVFIKSQTTDGAVAEANAAVQEFSKTFTKPKQPNQ